MGILFPLVPLAALLMLLNLHAQRKPLFTFGLLFPDTVAEFYQGILIWLVHSFGPTPQHKY